MDYQQKLYEMVAQTLDHASVKKLPRSTWAVKDGPIVEGWLLDQDSHSDETHDGQFYRDRWGTTSLIFQADGAFFTYQRSYEESSEFTGTKEWETLEPTPLSVLSGRKGKPFSEVIAKLERLPYR